MPFVIQAAARLPRKRIVAARNGNIVMIFDQIREIYVALVNYISMGDPALKGSVGIALAALAAFVCRNIPAQIVAFLERRLINVLEIGFSESETSVTLGSFESWLHDNAKYIRLRTFRIDPEKGVQAGYGKVFFRYKNRIYYLSRTFVENQNGKPYHRLTIKTLAFVDPAFGILGGDWKEWYCDLGVQITAISNDGAQGKGVKSFPKHSPIPSGVRNGPYAEIRTFLKSRDWYAQRGLAYKLAMIAHGVPGGGKTTMIRNIASELGLDITVISPSTCMDRIVGAITGSFSRTGQPIVVCIEDFECIFTNRRITEAKKDQPAVRRIGPPGGTIGLDREDAAVNLSSFLNALDGIFQLDNVILIFTTNKLEYLDDALIRAGRIDKIFDIGLYTSDDVHAYIQFMYPNEPYDEGIVFPESRVCDLHAALLNNRFDIGGFIDMVMAAQLPAEVDERVNG